MRADYQVLRENGPPSIHMPRWASRLTLELTDVRVERLQDISEQDAVAEGIERCAIGGRAWRIYSKSALPNEGYPNPRDSYESLWQSINSRSSWDANPWVWVLAFNVHHGNVDDNPTLR